MKKLMIAAAVAALTAGAFAGNCAEEVLEDVDCGLLMTVKFSGKTASEKNLEYKTVQKISGKGILTITDYATELLEVKVGKAKYDVLLEDGEVTKLTVFGKNLEKTIKDFEKYRDKASTEDEAAFWQSLLDIIPVPNEDAK